LLDELCELLDSESVVDAADMDPLARELGLVDLAGGEVVGPVGPVLRRLLPEAYPRDADASREFRRFTDASLRTAKIKDAQTMRDGLQEAESHSGGKVTLSQPQAAAWVRAINDLRLALAMHLGITADHYPDPATMGDDDPQAAQAAIYDFLTWWQDSLVTALLA